MTECLDYLTLNQVGDMLRDGRISREEADQYFQQWCVGKLEHRWQGGPQTCYVDRNGADCWFPFNWSSARTRNQ